MLLRRDKHTSNTKTCGSTDKPYDWMYDNAMAFGLYSYGGVWPVGRRLDPDWVPYDFSEVRAPAGFDVIFIKININ